MAVRSRFRSDGATRFHEVEGGLNDVTLRKFRQMLREQQWLIEYYRPIAVKGWSIFTKLPLLNEMLCNGVVAVLQKPEKSVSHGPQG